MNPNLKARLENIISTKTDQQAEISSGNYVGGGCINNAQVIDLKDGRKFFLKTNSSPLPQMFQREEEGLNALHQPGKIKVPLAFGSDRGESGITPFILIEHIKSGKPKKDFWQKFGEQFAQFHQTTTAEQFGFEADNYLGSTPQKNTWTNDWVQFWREHRLGYQLQLAKQNGFHNSELHDLGNQLSKNLDQFLSQPDEPPTLLHGDLWSGNYMVDHEGDPVIIDPAVYYGHREADLAMTLLFGRFDSKFYQSYNEVWPLAENSEVRLEIYKLYHLLNHLNLFGSSYLASSINSLRQILNH